MFAISTTEAKDLIANVSVRLNKPVMLWGKPGVGKSSLIGQVAKEIDAIVVDVRLGQRESIDLRGVPTVIGDLTVWNKPSELPFEGNDNFPDDKIILLVFDEINTAAPSVQAAAYQAVLEKRIGEFPFKSNVRIVAAGNREGDKGATQRMATPLANRFIHAEVIEDVHASTMYAQEQGWPQEWVAFINFRKPLLSTFDPAKPDKAFATPRSWETAMQIYADQTMGFRTKQVGMAGAVGEGTAAEFWAFVDTWQELSTYLPMIRKDPDGAPLPAEFVKDKAKGMSLTYAITVALSGELDKANIGGLHRFLTRLEPEYVILAWQLAINRDKALRSTKEFLEFAKRYKAVF